MEHGKPLDCCLGDEESQLQPLIDLRPLMGEKKKEKTQEGCTDKPARCRANPARQCRCRDKPAKDRYTPLALATQFKGCVIQPIFWFQSYFALQAPLSCEKLSRVGTGFGQSQVDRAFLDEGRDIWPPWQTCAVLGIPWICCLGVVSQKNHPSRWKLHIFDERFLSGISEW